MMRVSQRVPVKPTAHVQRKKFGEEPCEQMAPFWQGDEAHSLRSVCHIEPVKPGAHRQVKRPASLRHVPPFLQGDDTHSLRSVWHWVPVKPGGQVPPLRHGEEVH